MQRTQINHYCNNSVTRLDIDVLARGVDSGPPGRGGDADLLRQKRHRPPGDRVPAQPHGTACGGAENTDQPLLQQLCDPAGH